MVEESREDETQVPVVGLVVADANVCNVVLELGKSASRRDAFGSASLLVFCSFPLFPCPLAGLRATSPTFRTVVSF